MEFKFSGKPLNFAFSRQDSSIEVDQDDAPSSKFLDLPVEIHAKILSYVDITDVLSYASTCKLFYRYADSQLLWKIQWVNITNSTQLEPKPRKLLSAKCVKSFYGFKVRCTADYLDTFLCVK